MKLYLIVTDTKRHLFIVNILEGNLSLIETSTMKSYEEVDQKLMEQGYRRVLPIVVSAKEFDRQWNEYVKRVTPK